MAIQPKPRKEVEAAWREWLSNDRRSLPPSRNQDHLLFLTDPMRMAYRGRIYELLPVSFRAGVKAIHLQEQTLQAALAHDFAAYEVLLAEAVNLIRSNVRPHRASWVVRLAWRLGWNPFKDATEREIGEFLAGFTLRRTMPRG